MAENLFIKRNGALWPLDDCLSGMADETVINCKWTRSRSGPQHRLFFALLKKVFDNQTECKTMDVLLAVIKLGTGHAEVMKTAQGFYFSVPKSISFSKMDRDAFEKFFRRAVDFVVSDILPGIDKSALTAEVYQMAGVPMSLLEDGR